MKNTINDDNISIEVDGRLYTGWKNWKVTAGIESVPRSFTITIAGNSPQSTLANLKSGKSCKITLGNDLLLNGYIGAVNKGINANQFDAKITGTSRFVDFIDSTIPPQPNSQISSRTLPQIAEMLAQPHNLTVTTTPPDSAIIPVYGLSIGETAYDVTETIARYRGYLVYDSPNGDVILSRAGSTRHTGRLVQGQPQILSAEILQDNSNRYAEYNVYWEAVSRLDQEVRGDNVHGSSRDSAIRSNRRLDIVSNQIIDGNDVAQLRADWELNRRIGRSFQLALRVFGYRDSSGTIWTPNKLVSIKFPYLDIGSTEFLITNCSYEQNQDGSVTTMILMPPSAFAIQPTAIQNQLNPGLAQEIARVGALPTGVQGANQ